jgi:hypothetical protein
LGFADVVVAASRRFEPRTKATRKLNLARIGDIVSYEEDMQTAHQMAAADRFYVSMNMYWRGRVYGITFFNFPAKNQANL